MRPGLARFILMFASILVIIALCVIPSLSIAGSISEYDVSSTGTMPWGITAGSDGALWFTVQGADKVGRITTAGAVTSIALPTGTGGTSGITRGPDGAIWYTSAGGRKVGRISMTGGTGEFDVDYLAAETNKMGGIASGSDGALWFIENGSNQIGRITTSGTVSHFGGVTGGANLWDIAAGPDGSLWFTEYTGNRIGRMTTSGTINEYDLPANSGPRGLAAGPDGAVWICEMKSGKIARMNTSGALTNEFDVGSSNYPNYITVGADGALWFTEAGGNKIGSITTAGAVTQYAVPSGSSVPTGIAKGPDDAVWFTEYSGNRIGTLEGPAPPPPPPPPPPSVPNFNTYVVLQNPNAQAANVKLTYMLQNGETDEEDVVAPATSRKTINVNDSIGPDKSVSIAVSSDRPVIAERPMYFNYRGTWTGGHDVVGAVAPADTFYFAEGTCRPDFDPYICIQNPGSSAASVRITYMKGDATNRNQDVSVPAQSRSTVVVKDLLGEADDAAHDFSAKVECTNGQEIIAERPMYFKYAGAWTGGHNVMGALAPAPAFYFAEGTCRPDFDPYICIQNPGAAAAAVKITYMKGNGTTDVKTLSVAKNSRSTVKVKDHLGEGNDAAHDFSAKVECTNGQHIIAERPMYFNYHGYAAVNWTGGHDVVGALAPATTFYFAEGTCRPDFDSYFCIQNPGTAAASVRLTYMLGDATTDVQTVSVAKNSRYTLRVKDHLGEGSDAAHDFCTKVECTNGQQIIVERPIYFDYHGYSQLSWTGGHDVVGTASPARDWYFAEGYTGQ